MAEMREPGLVNLNEVVRLLEAVSSGRLRDVLTPPAEALAQCDYLCDCHHRYCTCHGSLTAAAIDRVSYPEFMKMREQRLTELRAELKELESTGE